LGEEVSRDLGLDVGILEAVEKSHPRLRSDDILLEDGRGLNIRGRRRGRRWFFTGGKGESGKRGRNEKEAGKHESSA
jgi:hypothetical protein